MMRLIRVEEFVYYWHVSVCKWYFGVLFFACIVDVFFLSKVKIKRPEQATKAYSGREEVLFILR